jgi:hypothetical protein
MGMSLKNRVSRLEVEQETVRHCLLCQLILQACGKSVSEAAELARHAAHTLEEIVLESDPEPRARFLTLLSSIGPRHHGGAGAQ